MFEVTITNEYTNTPVQTGSVQITKVVVPNVPAGVVLPATFTSEVVCDDGTDVLVTMPGSGGPGTPIVHPQVNALCVLEETGIDQFPAQQIVSYSVDGGPPSTEPADVRGHQRDPDRRRHHHQRPHGGITCRSHSGSGGTR